MVRVDKMRAKQAIRKAERRPSGQICVSLSPPFWGDVWKAAESVFERLGLASTEDPNAVLFSLWCRAPQVRRVAGAAAYTRKWARSFGMASPAPWLRDSGKAISHVVLWRESKKSARGWPAIFHASAAASLIYRMRTIKERER
jgi:hypothetical protein